MLKKPTVFDCSFSLIGSCRCLGSNAYFFLRELKQMDPRLVVKFLVCYLTKLTAVVIIMFADAKRSVVDD